MHTATWLLPTVRHSERKSEPAPRPDMGGLIVCLIPLIATLALILSVLLLSERASTPTWIEQWAALDM